MADGTFKIVQMGPRGCVTTLEHLLCMDFHEVFFEHLLCMDIHEVLYRKVLLALKRSLTVLPYHIIQTLKLVSELDGILWVTQSLMFWWPTKHDVNWHSSFSAKHEEKWCEPTCRLFTGVVCHASCSEMIFPLVVVVVLNGC